MNERKEYLIFLSDQHRGDFIHAAGNNLLRTLTMDMLSEKGTRFDNAYTACPFCVPARVSMLSGDLPMHTQVYTNQGSIRDDAATFLHSLAAEGYETVLCGRMHFEGPNQRHGFTKRIFGDILPLYPGQEDVYQEMGYYRPTFTEHGCSQIVGGGDQSPTLNYDRQVIRKALEYMKQEHKKPQCIVVGTYAPHFPFVGPADLYQYYYSKLKEQDQGDQKYDYVASMFEHRYQYHNRERVLKMRSAYYAMVENMDRQIGSVYQAWEEFLQRRGTKGVFVYTSDHGEQLGERNLYAKKTLFDNAARIPMIFVGAGVKKGYVCHTPISIMDVGVTFCDMENAMIPYGTDAKSLQTLLKGNEDDERVTFSECIEKTEKGFCPGIMVRKGKYKLIRYYGYENQDLLFDMEKDPKETRNLAEEKLEIVGQLSSVLSGLWDPEQIIRDHIKRTEHIKILMKWGKSVRPEEKERWHIPKKALEMPKII